MKDRTGAIVRPEQERYLDRLLPPRDDLAAEMETVAREEGVPISDPEVAQLLQVLARSTGARRILEVGCALGYGALHLARGAPEAQVDTVDRDEAMLRRAKEYLERGEVADRVRFLHGPALEVLPTLEPPYDLAYVDAAKGEYRRYLDLLLPKLTVGGMMVFDNLLWKGWVAEPPAEAEGGEDEQTEAIRTFNPYMMIHPQLDAVVLPLGDGVGLATKLQPTVMEMGGPF